MHAKELPRTQAKNAPKQYWGHHRRLKPQYKHWLLTRGSLTRKILSHTDDFVIDIVDEGIQTQRIGRHGSLHRRRYWQRVVVIKSHQQPLVLAVTRILASDLKHWPFLRKLGKQSLGSKLFQDPTIVRSHLYPIHALKFFHSISSKLSYNKAQNIPETFTCARHGVYFKNNSRLDLTEILFPAILLLGQTNY